MINMARLVVVNITLERKPFILAILIGLLFVIIAVSEIKTQPPMPIYLRVATFLVGMVGIILSLWRLTHDVKLYRNVLRLYKEIRVENDKIIFPKELKLKPGTLKCWYSSGDISYGHTFKESGDAIKVRELSIEDFKGNINVLAGFDSRIAIGEGLMEWMELPAYEIIDEEYKVLGYSIYLTVLPPVKQYVTVSKSTLFVTNGKDTGFVEIKSGEYLEGVLSFQKKGKARGVRLEFVFKTLTVSYKSVIARLNNSGSTRFRFKTTPDETIFILVAGLFFSTSRIVREVGVHPIIIGDAWKKGRAKIKLVLDLPRAVDLVDETNVFVN